MEDEDEGSRAQGVKYSSTDAACWVWKTLWDERKRRQKRQKQRELNGQNQPEAAAAPKPLHFRLLDAVLFDQGGTSVQPALGVFTSRTGELMRRSSATLDPTAVRSRMAQVALGSFGSSNFIVSGADDDTAAPPIAVAHYGDGSTREVAGGAHWDSIVGAGVKTGNLRALTAWASPSGPAGDVNTNPASGAGAMRLRNSYRVITEGSQFGKIQTTTHRVVSRAAVEREAGVKGGKPGKKASGGKDVSSSLLVPSRAAELNKRLDQVTAQLVRLLEGTSRSRRVVRLIVDIIVQPQSSPWADNNNGGGGNGTSPTWKGAIGKGVKQKTDGNQFDVSSAVLPPSIWFERAVEVEVRPNSAVKPPVEGSGLDVYLGVKEPLQDSVRADGRQKHHHQQQQQHPPPQASFQLQLPEKQAPQERPHKEPSKGRQRCAMKTRSHQEQWPPLRTRST
jgi:hypothetical protein